MKLYFKYRLLQKKVGVIMDWSFNNPIHIHFRSK